MLQQLTPVTNAAILPGSVVGLPENCDEGLKILWLTHVDPRYGMEHGWHLRLFSFARELMLEGHEVYFALSRTNSDDEVARREYLDQLKEAKILTDYFELDYKHPFLLGKLARLVTHPSLSNRVLKSAQAPVIAAVRSIISENGINFCIVADRNLLFTIPAIKNEVKTIIDWVDSYALYYIRELRCLWKGFNIRQFSRSLRFLVYELITESFYGRRSAANVVVSPIDKKCLDRLNRSSSKNRVILNGTTMRTRPTVVPKVKNQIIFSGNMDFPPNYQSAIWFIDHVFPLVLERKPLLKLIIAGANPTVDLLARSSSNVEIRGFVKDLGGEIARSELYVAPLVSGGGFKNKVIEAIVSGTYLVTTSMAVEFLSHEAQRLILVADTPAQIANAIANYFENPQKFEPCLLELQELIAHGFSWKKKTRELVELANEVLSRTAPAPFIYDSASN